MCRTVIRGLLSCLTPHLKTLNLLGNLGLLTLLVSSYFNLLMTLLICIDLDDVPIASPESPQDSDSEMGGPGGISGQYGSPYSDGK
jgi:hypothetical protein